MNTDKRDFPIEDHSEIGIGNFVQIPIKDTRGIEINIGAIIIESDNKLPGNPIVLFAPGDGETLTNYIWFSDNFCPLGVSFCAMDYRGRGCSEGEYATYGDNEIDECLCCY